MNTQNYHLTVKIPARPPGTDEVCALGWIRCRKCEGDKMDPNLDVGWTARGVQVWCRTHRCNVLMVDS